MLTVDMSFLYHCFIFSHLPQARNFITFTISKIKGILDHFLKFGINFLKQISIKINKFNGYNNNYKILITNLMINLIDFSIFYPFTFNLFF